MTLNEITMQTEEPLHTVRQCYEWASLMASDLLNEYFSVDNSVDISDQKEWWKLAHGFKNAETRSEIILDALARMRDALTEVEAVMEQIRRETPPPMIDPITGGITRAKISATSAKKRNAD